jgi:hypothetical protein
LNLQLFSSFASQSIKRSSYMLHQTSILIFLTYNQAHSPLFKYTKVHYKRPHGKTSFF